MNTKIIAFDADDTLWHNEINYRNAEREFAKAMLPFCNYSEQQIIDYLMEVEGRNIPMLGYGSKTFIIDLAEAAMELCHNNAPNELIRHVMEIGKKTITPKIELFPHVIEVLETLSHKYKLVLATKGDLKDQKYKINNSNLAHFFSHIEIMPEKDSTHYKELLYKCNVTPQEFIMIGNSFKSDIKPVIEIGASAIYIPSKIIWAHEVTEEFEHPRLKKLDSIAQVPEILSSWVNA